MQDPGKLATTVVLGSPMWFQASRAPAGSPSTNRLAIVESSDDAIIAKNLDGIIQSCNAAAERLFGYPASELIGQTVRVLIPAERQAEEDDILARIRRGERVDHFETVRLTKDGRPIEISLTVSPVRDPSGAMIGVSKTARDITERKRAAAALAAQQEWYRVTLASIGDAIITSDPDGRVTYMNGVAETLTGWTNEAAKGMPLADVFHIVNEATCDRIDNPAGLVIRSGHVVGLANHTLLIAADGTERPIDDSGAPIRNRNGRIVGVVLVFRDVSERRRAEAERDAAASDRERLLVAERSARAEAERATTHGLEIVARNARLQTQLISDLLDISRIIAGKLRLDMQSVHLASVIDAAVETVEPAAEAKGVVIDRHLDAAIAPLAGDMARSPQVVWNLLSNALKFTPKGGRVAGRLPGRDRRRGQRRGYPPRFPSLCLRSLPTGRCVANAAIRWSRARPVNRQKPRGVAWRHGAGGERRRR